MDSYLKAAILNAGFSVNSTLSLFYIISNTTYNEDVTKEMSDTPCKVGCLSKAEPGAVVHFASNNVI